jgi:hypothetical protein
LPLETLQARLHLETDPLAVRSGLEPLLEIADRAPLEQRSAFICVYANALIASGKPHKASELLDMVEAPTWLQARLEVVRQHLAPDRSNPPHLQTILEHAPPLDALELLCLLKTSKAQSQEIDRLERQLIDSLKGFPELTVKFHSRLGTLRERGKAHDALRRKP